MTSHLVVKLAKISDDGPVWLQETCTVRFSKSFFLITHHRIAAADFLLGKEDFVMEVKPGTACFDYRAASPVYSSLIDATKIPKDVKSYVKLVK